ncbi:MAG: glycosyltransferase [Flavobacteriales bacterium]
MPDKILFISYDGMTDPLGQSQVLPYLCGLSNSGTEIHLLSFEKPERFSEMQDLIRRICMEYGITWHPHAYTKSPPVLSTLKDIRTMRAAIRRLDRQHHFAILHCRSYIAMQAAFPFQKTGKKILFDMRGFWADERVDGGLWNLEHALYRRVYNFFKKQEKKWLEQSDAVVSLTHAAAEHIQAHYRVAPERLSVIPCCTDETLFVPHPKPLKGPFTLLYSGSLGTWYLLQEMLDFFVQLRVYYPDAMFKILTMEPESVIYEVSDKLGIERSALIIKAVKRRDMALEMNGADAGIFFLKQAFSKMASSPVKQGEMMAMGIPLFCNEGVGDSSYILKTYHSGVVIPEYTPETYRKAIETFRETTFDPEAIRAGALDYFSLAAGIRAYRAVYDKLL